MRALLVSFLVLSLTARAASAGEPDLQPAPAAIPDEAAPSDSVPASSDFVLQTAARRPWWRPAAISLGATVAAAGLSLALTRTNSTQANALGWTLLPVALTLAPTLGWADADDSGAKRSAAVGFAIARGAVFVVGWTGAGIAALNSLCLSTEPGGASQCPTQSELDKDWRTAKVIFWVTPMVAGALAVADILTQAAFADAPPIHLAPTMLQTSDNKKVPGLALGGSF